MLSFTLTDLVGSSASATAVVLMLPQVIKLARTREARGLSLGTMMLYLINCSLWLSYGWLIDAHPIIFCNVVAVAIGLVQLWLWSKCRRSTESASRG